jgi:hypothetical protein
MDSISKKEIDYLRRNINTGIEFEYALFYLLNSEKDKKYFLSEIVEFHDCAQRIKHIINGTDISNLISKLSSQSWTNYIIKLGTQVDDIGPADLILENESNDQLGLSVKYENNCTLNVSGKYFLTSESIDQLKSELYDACESYISQMSFDFGEVQNWFRQRKTSIVTDVYIDKIRDRIIDDWNSKHEVDKRNLLTKLIHADSPINFWVVKFIKNKNGYSIDLNTTPVKILDPRTLVLTKESTSYIGFKCQNELLAKMQVKFNNGIIEKAKGNKIDFNVEGVLMKVGDPFGSWNFSF